MRDPLVLEIDQQWKFKGHDYVVQIKNEAQGQRVEQHLKWSIARAKQTHGCTHVMNEQVDP